MNTLTPASTDVPFSLTNPTMILAYVLQEHRAAFFHFLLHGPSHELTKERMRRGIDLFLDLREGDGVKRTDAQLEITPCTTPGMQNLYCVLFFCDVLK